MTKRLGGVRTGWLVLTVAAVLASTGCESPQQTELDVAVSEQGLFGVSTCPAGSNIIQGTNSANTLTGTAGVDCILGNGGNDTIYGLGGDDTLIGGGGSDTIYGGDGNDRIEGETDSDFLYGEAGDDKIYGSGGNDDIYGGDGADEISGLDGSDDIWGGAGNDLIRGDTSTDKIWGDDGDDVIFGGPHADTIRGGNGRDVILGEDAADFLYGEADDDYLIGGLGANTIDGGTGTDACTGTSCEAAAPVPNGCTSNANCAAGKECVVPAGLCITAAACADGDSDGTCDTADLCPADPAKVAPGQCGCGVADTDGDGDGTATCNDGCPADAGKVGVGVCGCGVADTDSDGDGTANCNDLCPADAAKVAAGVCGCGVSDADGDSDGTPNCNDGCALDPAKVAPGACGCGTADADTDVDGVLDCVDECPGGDDTADYDGDGIPDECDLTSQEGVGVASAGFQDWDANGTFTTMSTGGTQQVGTRWNNGYIEKHRAAYEFDFSALPLGAQIVGAQLQVWLYSASYLPGGWDLQFWAYSADGSASLSDASAAQVLLGTQRITSALPFVVDVSELADLIAHNPKVGILIRAADETASFGMVTVAGYQVTQGLSLDVTYYEECTTDSDGDATPDCGDECRFDPTKVELGVCGCGVPEVDSDADTVLDCVDQCPGGDDRYDLDDDGIPEGCDINVFSPARVESGYLRDEGINGTVDTVTTGQQVLHVTKGYTCTPTPCEMRSVLEWDFAGLPQDAVVDSATLTFTTAQASYGAWNVEVWGYAADGVVNASDYTRTEVLLRTFTLPTISYNVEFSVDLPGLGAALGSGPLVGMLLRVAPNQQDVTLGFYGFTHADAPQLDLTYHIDCAADSDVDGVSNCADLCRGFDDGEDTDTDGIIDGCDSCVGSSADSDGDGTADCHDGCPADAAKVLSGVCGCGVSDADGDMDGTADCNDGCPADAVKVAAGVCGCGVADTDSDSDGTANCIDGCPADAAKVASGVCGCGVSDADGDSDGTPNCNDLCPADAAKVAPGQCGCGVSDIPADSDGDGTLDCADGCLADATKVAPGVCGCGVSDADSDGDGTVNCQDGCPSDAAKVAAGACGCGVADADSDGDGSLDCMDGCPADAAKVAAGQCGCGVSDTDSDGDNTANCNDGCPLNAPKTAPGTCGCAVADTDTDGDGVPNCVDQCHGWPDQLDADGDGIPNACDILQNGCTWSTTGSGVYEGDYVVDGVNTAGDLAGLNGIACIKGSLIIGNTTLSNLSALSRLRYVLKTLRIGDYGSAPNPNLTSLQGLENMLTFGALAVESNANLTSLQPLSRVLQLAGWAQNLTVRGNPKLQSLAGLNAHFSGGFYIDNNVLLSDISALSATSGAISYFNILRSPALTSLAGLEGITFVVSTFLLQTNTAMTDISALAGLTHVGASMTIEGLNGVDDLSGLSGLQSVGSPYGGGLHVKNMPGLTDLSGLEALTTLVGTLEVSNNANLTSLAGLSGLTSVDGLAIGSNPQLAVCEVSQLESALSVSCQPGACEGNDDTDSDSDGTPDCGDECVNDPAKSSAGVCGCGVSDADGDGDGTANCLDGCPADAGKVAAGVCGCGITDVDSDGDGTLNCNDGCPADAAKVSDVDSDGDGTLDCNDGCPVDAAKLAAGPCGCGASDADADGDQTADCNDGCPADALKLAAGQCGCGVADTDGDGDGTPDCNDGCVADPAKVAAGVCGCGVADTDSDGDGTANCNDACAADPAKVAPGECGCGFVDVDSDADGSCDSADLCPGHDDSQDTDADGIPNGCEECQASADCDDGNECTAAACTFYGECSITPILGTPIELLNWNFSSGSYSGWSHYATWLSGGATQAVAVFNTSGAGNSFAAKMNVGTTSVGTAAGKGVLQFVNLNDGTLTVSAKVATHATINNADGGTYSLLVDGVTVASTVIGSVVAGQTYRRTLSATVGSLQDGMHLIDVRATRTQSSTFSISSYVDDITLGGPAAVTAVGCGAGMGTCDPAGACILCPDQDADLTCDEDEDCPNDPAKTDAGACGCGLPETDTDSDGTPDCVDECPDDPAKVAPMDCGCGVEDIDSDGDGTGDCIDLCPGGDDWLDADSDGVADACDSDGGCNSNSAGPTVYVGDVWVDDSSYLSYLYGVTCINGSLEIDATNGPADLPSLGTLRGVVGNLGVTGLQRANLNFLGQLERVGQDLRIVSTELQSLRGLENLVHVGSFLSIADNPLLTNLWPLSNLASLGSVAAEGDPRLMIIDNNNLPACAVPAMEAQTGTTCGFPDGYGGFIACTGNDGVGYCDPPCAPGASGPGIYDGDLYYAYDDSTDTWVADDPADLVGVTCVTGSLIVDHVPFADLSFLYGLQATGGPLSIYWNDNLTSLSGLESLSSVGDVVSIYSNAQLADLSALSNLTSIAAQSISSGSYTLLIAENPELSGCWVWDVEQRTGERCGWPEVYGGTFTYSGCDNNTGTGSCGTLPPNFACVPGATGPGVYDRDLVLAPMGTSDPNAVDPFALGGLTCVTGMVYLQSIPFPNLDFLSSLQFVGGSMFIAGHPYASNLTSLTGLENLVAVGEGLYIHDHPYLTNLAALSNLTSIGPQIQTWTTLIISANQALPACWVDWLEQQTGKTCGWYPLANFTECSANNGSGSCPPP